MRAEGRGLFIGAAPEGIVARRGRGGGTASGAREGADLKSKSEMLRTDGLRETVVGVWASASV